MFSKLDMPRFTTQAIAKAAGVSFNTLETWLSRGQIALPQNDPGEGRHPGQGRTRLFSARRALHIALTARLVPTLSARAASAAALHFTDMGTANSEFPGFGPGDPVRAPGELIPGADCTVFRLLIPSGGGDPIVSIETLGAILSAPFVGGHLRYQAVLLVDLDDLLMRTLASLEGSVR